jgi:flagella basal body P-ring formation protein FlgA
MMFLASFAIAGCLALPAGAERVTAADLAPAFAGLESVPPTTALSFAPEPGLERVFRIPELLRIAAQFHLAAAPEDEICVARTVAPLESAKLLAAMQKEMPGAKIAIVEFSQQAAPPGEISFRRGGLRSNSLAGAIWFGAVRYAPGRDFTIWAKVMMTAQVSHLVAKRDIAPGQRIEPEDAGIEMREEFPSPLAAPASAQAVAAPNWATGRGEVTGKCSRVAIHAGAVIRPESLEKFKDVHQGDIVEVEVQDGSAHLKFEARAEAPGAVGDAIPVRNPASGKRFLAKVQGTGRVFVDGSAARENP